MPVKDYYKLLKIAHSADLNTIKKAYRQLAMQYHPDKHGDNQSTHFYFQEIQEAYEVLSNPEKRENYHYKIGRQSVALFWLVFSKKTIRLGEFKLYVVELEKA